MGVTLGSEMWRGASTSPRTAGIPSLGARSDPSLLARDVAIPRRVLPAASPRASRALPRAICPVLYPLTAKINLRLQRKKTKQRLSKLESLLRLQWERGGKGEGKGKAKREGKSGKEKGEGVKGERWQKEGKGKREKESGKGGEEERREEEGEK